MRILGKGNKVRILYLNDACQAALNRYLAVRRPITGRDANALFLSSQNERISRSTVHAMVKKRLLEAGLDATQYSSHKLRHTAATLMLQNGVDVRAVQEVLGHDHLNTTEICLPILIMKLCVSPRGKSSVQGGHLQAEINNIEIRKGEGRKRPSPLFSSFLRSQKRGILCAAVADQQHIQLPHRRMLLFGEQQPLAQALVSSCGFSVTRQRKAQGIRSALEMPQRSPSV